VKILAFLAQMTMFGVYTSFSDPSEAFFGNRAHGRYMGGTGHPSMNEIHMIELDCISFGVM
jgi:hypothetical protein